MKQNPSKCGEASDLIERLARIMRSGEHESGLNPAQWEALRYIARCNRFSNSPAALTDYVAATRGTVSQTLGVLERKGLIRKEKRHDDKRSVALKLTPAGEKTLAWDPWQRIDVHEHSLKEGALGSLIEGLQLLLEREFSRNQLKRFGKCRNCHFFQENAALNTGADTRPHQCGRHNAPLSDDETRLICASQEVRRAA